MPGADGRSGVFDWMHYGFTEEELDFIINYDIKYRMDDELESKE